MNATGALLYTKGYFRMTMAFETTGPQGRPLKWRELTERKDADTRVWRSIMNGPDGQEFEVMKATYTRRK
jgi:hypothetical protein